MSTVTDPIGNTDKAITQYEFFKSILSFYAGDAADDEYIALNASNLIYSGSPLGGLATYNFNSSNSTFEDDKCLVNGNIAITKYWAALQNTYGVPLTGSVIDLTTAYPWSGSSLGTKQIMTGNNTYTPFDTMSCFHNWLTDKVTFSFDTSIDGGLIDFDDSIYVQNLHIRTGTTTSSTAMWSAASLDYIDNEPVTVTPQHLFVNKTNNYSQYLFYALQQNEYSITGGPLTVKVYTGSTETLAKTTSFTPTYKTADMISGFTYIGSSTPPYFPTKIEITVPVKRRINWLNIDLSNLVDVTVGYIVLTYGLLTLTPTPEYLGDFCHLVAGWKMYNTYDYVDVVENKSYVDIQYEVWTSHPYDDITGCLIARINMDDMVNNTTGFKPALQLREGMWLCPTSYSLNSAPDGSGDYSSSWALLLDEYASEGDTIYFSENGLMLFHNLSITNILSCAVEVNGHYISGYNSIPHGLYGDVTLIIYNQGANLNVVVYLDELNYNRVEVSCYAGDNYTEARFVMSNVFGSRGGRVLYIKQA